MGAPADRWLSDGSTLCEHFESSVLDVIEFLDFVSQIELQGKMQGGLRSENERCLKFYLDRLAFDSQIQLQGKMQRGLRSENERGQKFFLDRKFKKKIR